MEFYVSLDKREKYEMKVNEYYERANQKPPSSKYKIKILTYSGKSSLSHDKFASSCILSVFISTDQ